MDVNNNHFYGTNKPYYDNGNIAYSKKKSCHYCCFLMNNVIYVVVLEDNGKVFFSSVKNKYNVDKIVNNQFDTLFLRRNISKCLSKFNICLAILNRIINKKQLTFNNICFICPDLFLQNSFQSELLHKNNLLSLEKINFKFNSIMNYSTSASYCFTKY